MKGKSANKQAQAIRSPVQLSCLSLDLGLGSLAWSGGRWPDWPVGRLVLNQNPIKATKHEGICISGSTPQLLFLMTRPVFLIYFDERKRSESIRRPSHAQPSTAPLQLATTAAVASTTSPLYPSPNTWHYALRTTY